MAADETELPPSWPTLASGLHARHYKAAFADGCASLFFSRYASAVALNSIHHGFPCPTRCRTFVYADALPFAAAPTFNQFSSCETHAAQLRIASTNQKSADWLQAYCDICSGRS